MFAILNITAPIFLLIALGYAAVRHGLLTRNELTGLGRFVINFAVPSLLFNATAQRSSLDLLDFELLRVYTLGSLAVVAGALMVVCILQKHSLRTGVIYAMGMSLSNSAFIGFPIATQLIGSSAGTMLTLYVIVEVMILLPLLLILAEAGETNGGNWTVVFAEILTRLVKNPMILAILLGIAMSSSRFALPPALSRAIDMLSGASAPVALFYIGGTLTGLSLKGMTKGIFVIAFGKLILHPLAIFTVFCILHFNDPGLKSAAIINAGMPMLSIYPILGQKYGQENFCAAAMVITTILSFFSLNALLWLSGLEPIPALETFIANH